MSATPAVRRREHGTVDGEPIGLYQLDSPSGLRATISELGAILVALEVPDATGRRADVVLGCDRLADYLADVNYLGCVVGRVANRIAGGVFTLDGHPHALTRNEGRHHLHGGTGGFSRAIWRAAPVTGAGGPELSLRYRSPDGEDGYPGAVDARVSYTLTDQGELHTELAATTDRPTLVNLSQHSYWNLAGHAAGGVLDHRLTLCASRYTPADRELIPTGAIVPVQGGPCDFTRERTLGAALGELAATTVGAPGAAPGGFDVNFVVDGAAGTLRHAATLRDPSSGRAMELWTTEPGLQLYTGNHLAAVAGKRGAIHGRHAGLCLEAQRFPDAVHHQGEPGWPSVVLRPDETYRQVTVYRFAAA